MAAWGKELLDPKTSGVAAMKLEGLGATGTREPCKRPSRAPTRRSGSSRPSPWPTSTTPPAPRPWARRRSSMPEFRAYALAALAAMDQTAAHMKLRKLMDEPDIEVRYGAFNALRTLDPHDPSLGQVRVLDDPKTEEDDQDESPDSMAIALASASRRPRPEDPFALYIVDSEGPPVVHVSRTRRSEVVVFGRNQKLLPPIVLGSGAILLNAADKDDEIEISKIVPSKFGDSDVKLRTSLDLGEVIRRAANLGATYPEIVSILETADRQKNLPGTSSSTRCRPRTPSTSRRPSWARTRRPSPTPSLQRASAQGPGSRFRRLLGLRNREPGEAGAAKPAAGGDAARSLADRSAAKAARPLRASRLRATPRIPPRRCGDLDDRRGTGAATAPVGDNAPSAGPKKDDGLQRAGGDTDEAPRSRLLDRFRRRSE